MFGQPKKLVEKIDIIQSDTAGRGVIGSVMCTASVRLRNGWRTTAITWGFVVILFTAPETRQENSHGKNVILR